MLNTALQTFQFLDKYSRWNHDEGRRETWEESVDRSVRFLKELSDGKLEDSVFEEIRYYMKNQMALPSMRLLAMAGEAARRDNVALYNCSAIAVDSLESLSEIMVILMSGTGVGTSVESHFINQLPKINPAQGKEAYILVEDSQVGWKNAFLEYLEKAWDGYDVFLDISKVRPKGAPLKIKGGTASGGEVLVELCKFVNDVIKNNATGHLSSVEVADIVTKVGDVVVSGGVRRSAIMILFDRHDDGMMNYKGGEWWKNNPQRANANISAVMPKEISSQEIRDHMTTMFNNFSGEPGIFVRENSVMTSPRRKEFESLTNPCGEIFLRSMQFCNLSQAICRSGDSIFDLSQKVRVATIIGTIQSTATHFPYIRDKWRKNCEEERLLGVDLTGQHALNLTDEDLRTLREVAIQTNKLYASELGVNQSAAITCVKPSGNSSVLLDCTPGIHTDWSEYYIRRARVSEDSPLVEVLKQSGIPIERDVMKPSQWVASFYTKGKGKRFKSDFSAIEQLEYWKMNKLNWTEHNPSVTISYREEEREGIINWMINNWNYVCGISFLPFSDHTYQQAPYESISEEEYEKHKDQKLNVLSLYKSDNVNNVTSSREVACTGGVCEII